MPAWKDYQEEAAEFFRSLGLDANTDVNIQGVRTKHDVDVLVKSHITGSMSLGLLSASTGESQFPNSMSSP